jgi:cell division protein FtsQ
VFTRRFWIYFSRVLFVFLAVSLLGVLQFQLVRQGYYDLREFHIEILNRNQSSERLLDHFSAQLKSKLEKFHGQSLWALSLDEVSKELAQYTWIDSFKIVRIWPNKIELRLFAGEVAFNFVKAPKRGLSQIFPVTWQGRILEPVGAQLAPMVPFVNSRDLVENPESIQKTLKVLKDIPQEGMFSRDRISEIGFKKNDGFWVQLLESDVQVKLGEDQIARKSRRVAQVLDYVETRQIDVRVIDANLSKKVLVRLRKDF